MQDGSTYSDEAIKGHLEISYEVVMTPHWVLLSCDAKSDES